jgi:flagellar biosynthesis protein FlhF
MSIKRFTAANARDAMAQVKRELGDEALIISNRALTGGRVEILAAAAEAMDALVEDARPNRKGARDAKARSATVHVADEAPKIESFSDFLRRQTPARAAADAHAVKPAAMTIARPVGTEMYEQVAQEAGAPMQPAGKSPPLRSAKEESSTAAPAVFRQRSASPLPAPSTLIPPAQDTAKADVRLLEELQGMRALLLEQMATMSAAASATELQRRSPVQVRVMTRLLSAGFSADVARHIAGHLPAETTLATCDRWLLDVLALNIQCATEPDGIIERGGVFALVGPTGVGKTTTVAKLAARFAVRFGAAKLGLVTLDAYRVGAHEQLRTYGRILGTPVHLAQDAVTLAEVLAAMSHKRLVLIDTCGVSQRDERLAEMLDMLAQAGTPRQPVQRVLLLNAASHAETLEAVARAWHARESGAAILTKLDEAARIGGALDTVLRNKLVLMGATHGQRVPEDWMAAAGPQLAATALQPGNAPFALCEDEAALLASTQRSAITPIAA